MTDSLTQSDIDRIFERLQSDVDIINVTNKSELFQKVSSSSGIKQWNNELNDFFFNIAHPEKAEEVKEKGVSPYEVKVRKTRVRKEGQPKYTITRTRVVARPVKRWSEPELQKVTRLRKEGLTYKQISLQVKRSPASISNKVSRSKKGVYKA
jgi:hypothetical protein